MSNLFGTLRSSTGALRAFERSLEVVQNNVANASTPGFARVRHLPSAAAFQPEFGFGGGVAAGSMQSARDRYAEENTWRAQSQYSYSAARAEQLAPVESQFEITAGAGIPAALSKFFQSFSHLAVNPSNVSSRLVVLERAGELSRAF